MCSNRWAWALRQQLELSPCFDHIRWQPCPCAPDLHHVQMTAKSATDFLSRNSKSQLCPRWRTMRLCKMHHRQGLCAFFPFLQDSSDASCYSAPFVTVLFPSCSFSFCNPHFTAILGRSVVVTWNALSEFWFVARETDSHRMDSRDLAFILTCTCVFLLSLFFFFQERGTNAYAINSP